MATFTLSNAAAALKDDYLPVVREQLNSKTFLLSQIESNSEDVEGKNAVLSLHVKRNSGVGARLEGGTLPSAGSQTYAEQRVPMHYNYGRIQVSGPSIRAMKSDKGSFIRPVESETKGVTTDLRRDVNRQLYGTSDGKIAQAASAVANTSITLTTPTAVQLRQLEVGMIIDVGTVANPTLRASAIEITAVNTTTGVVTTSGTLANTTTTTDFIFRSGAGGATGGLGQSEVTGLQSIVAASGSLFNVDPATYPVWASTVDSNSGTLRPPTDTLFEKNADAVNIAGAADVDLWVTSDGVRRQMAAYLKSQKRFNDTVELKAGYKAISIDTGGSTTPSALMWDRDCPNNKAFGLDTDHLMQHQESDWDFMAEDGAVLSRVANKDAYEATLFKYHELTTDQRNAHCLISDLQEA